jgi:hypothetical protein
MLPSLLLWEMSSPSATQLSVSLVPGEYRLCQFHLVKANRAHNNSVLGSVATLKALSLNEVVGILHL